MVSGYVIHLKSKFFSMLLGVAENAASTVAAAKPIKKKKPSLSRRRSSDGFTMLLSYQSRLENLYNQTLRTQVHLLSLVFGDLQV